MDTSTTQPPSPPPAVTIALNSPLSTVQIQQATPQIPPLAPQTVLSVRVRCVRLLLGTFAAIASIVAIVFTLYKGVDLLHFDENAKTDVKTLVDDYNSYSANVASAVGRLISFVVGVVVQVVIVRFASNWALRDRSTRRFTLVEFFAVAAVEYLVLNSFNALNVQLNPVQIRPVIYPSDLSITYSANDSMLNIHVTNASRTYSEASQNNPVTNTVLRNLILPRVMKMNPSKRRCKLGEPNNRPDASVDIGIPSRSWQRDMLPFALEPHTLRVNVDNETSLDPAASQQLPMKASMAANLFANSLWIATQYAGWFNEYLTTVGDSTVSETSDDGKLYSATKLLQLLPNESNADESKKREWLLQQIRVILAGNLTNFESSPSTRAVAFEFSHVDIATNYSFDAVTFEVEIQDRLLGRKLPNGTSLKSYVPSSQCGPWPGMCMFNMPHYPGGFYSSDVPVQVNAFSVCLNEAHGDEEPYYYYEGRKVPERMDCSRTSDSAMHIVSVGKHLVADSLHDAPEDGHTAGRVVNLRKIYTLTIGRLAWHETNLSQSFHAACEIHDGKGCQGLQYPLFRGNQTLVARADNLPLDLMSPITPDISLASQPVPLVTVLEPPGNTEQYEDMDVEEYDLSGPLLPHNVHDVQWINKQGRECAIWAEDQLNYVLSNHFYMEHTLQTSYTAAMYFLFQDGIVKDTIKLGAEKTSLSFDHNIQEMTLRLSIPGKSTGLTLAGCAILALCALGVACYATSGVDPLEAINSPHAIAQVMLDEGKYPPSLLQCELVQLLKQEEAESVDIFFIDKISLQHQEDTTKQRVEFQEHTKDQSSHGYTRTVSV